MDTTRNTETPSSPPVLVDDGGLDQALAELDSKLAAWSDAVAGVQSSIRDLVEKQSPSRPAVPAPSLRVIAETEFHPAAVVASPKAEPAPEVRNTEDETLLASLDAETRNRILVLRRLHGHSKSVRELLEKHQSAAAQTPATPPVRKTFWRRLSQ